jgi:hypothetical protein
MRKLVLDSHYFLFLDWVAIHNHGHSIFQIYPKTIELSHLIAEVPEEQVRLTDLTPLPKWQMMRRSF